MLEQARALDPSGEYRLIRDNIAGEFAPGSFDFILAAFTFDNMPTEAKADALSALRTLLVHMDVYFWLSLHRRSTSMSGHPLARVTFLRIATRATVIGYA